MCTLTNCAKVHKQVNNEVEKSSKTIKNFVEFDVLEWSSPEVPSHRDMSRYRDLREVQVIPEKIKIKIKIKFVAKLLN